MSGRRARRPAAPRRQRVEVVAQDRRLGDERGDRRPQLVATSATKRRFWAWAVSSRRIVSSRVGHPVELLRPGRTRRRGDRHAGRQVAIGDPAAVRAARRPAARTPRATTRATTRAIEREDDDPETGPSGAGSASPSIALYVADEPDRGPVPPTTARRSGWAAVDRLPGVGDLARSTSPGRSAAATRACRGARPG
jgi:hypothetical protein